MNVLRGGDCPNIGCSLVDKGPLVGGQGIHAQELAHGAATGARRPGLVASMR